MPKAKTKKAPQDPVIKRILERVKKVPGDLRLYLFGSRARGDAKLRSDYDFALDGKLPHALFAAFKMNLNEPPITLKKIDLVYLPKVATGLRQQVLSEGKLLYGKKAK